MIETMTGFSALGLSEETLEALNEKGYENPTPIQRETIPLLMHGAKDIVGQAQTGSGKTAAFGIPLIEKYDPTIDGVQALVLTPTRELALQVSDEIQSYKGGRKIWLTTVYGGAPISRQMKDLEKGTDIVVGTPGRVIDLIKRKKLILDEVRYVVLDEADEMLNMGFLEDVEYILSMCNEERRMLLFSATMPKRILDLAKRYMGEYELIAVKNKTLTTASINQQYFEVPSRSRFDALCRILDVEEDFYGIVFCNTKAEVVEITNHLNEKGYTSDSLHGDIAQNLREQVIRQFKSNNFGLLIATDVAARGIDIHDLTHVINYGLPQDPESYVHRIGRTGRAGKDGKAISIIDSNERRKLQYIQRLTKAEITKVKLPDAKEMVAIKKRRISEQVETVISTEKYTSLMEFTHELLRENEPEMVIASLLKIFRGDDLDVNEYKDLQIVESKNRKERGGRNDRDSGRGRDRDNDRGGRKRRGNSGGATMRLFVAMGRKDKVSPRDILEMIGSETNIPSNKIDDIKILDTFSFFTTNEEDGEFILKTFKKKARTDNQKPLIEQARVRR
ncbi:MAG: DEAD/DEAH box helicase [Chitinophagales bacterium]|nr:DEAD/DEAH box helicase [Chitinophagales bacterium]